MSSGSTTLLPIATSLTLVENSDVMVPSQRAFKAYAQLDDRFQLIDAGAPSANIDSLVGTGSWVVAGAYTGTSPGSPFNGANDFEIRQTESAPGTPWQQQCIQGTNTWTRVYSGGWGAWAYHLPKYEPVWMSYTGGTIGTSSAALVNLHASAVFTIPSAGTYSIALAFNYTTAGTNIGIGMKQTATGGLVISSENMMYAYDALSSDRDTRNNTSGLAANSTSTNPNPGGNLFGYFTTTNGGTLTTQFRTEIAGNNVSINALSGYIQRIA